MATEKQIEANRRNALKSTGPKSSRGKAAVCLNSLRHGLRARTVVLPGENAEEFHQLCGGLESEWQPSTRTEQFYLEQMAVPQWKLTRMEKGEVSLFQQDTAASIQFPLLDRLWQAQGRLERSFARAQRELERLQSSRSRQVLAEDLPEDQPAEDVPLAAASSAGAGEESFTASISPATDNGERLVSQWPAPLPTLHFLARPPNHARSSLSGFDTAQQTGEERWLAQPPHQPAL